MFHRLTHNRFTHALRMFNKGFGAYKWHILLITMLGFGGGLLEAVGVNTIIPLFSYISGGESQANDFISRTIEHFFTATLGGLHVRYLLLFMVILFVLKACVQLLTNLVNVKITADYEKKTRTALFNSTLTTSWPYLLEQKIGYLEKIIMNDIGHSTYLLRYISQGILLATSLAMYTLVAVNISLPITLGAFAVGGVMFLALKRFVYRTRLVSQEYADMTKEVAHHVNESMIGAKTVKAMRAEGGIMQRGEEYFEKLKNLRIKNFLLQAIGQETIEPLGLIFIVVVFAFSFKSSNFNFASFAVIIYLIHKIFAYLQNAQLKIQGINEFLPYLKSVLGHKDHTAHHQEPDSGAQDFSFTRRLEMHNISFSYIEGRSVLKHFSCAIEKGEMVGLIGPSGAGKTTVVDVLLRLLIPTQGRLLLDGVDARDIRLSHWRASVGYVSQDIFLLNDTIAHNITFYDQHITQAKVETAARMAQCYDFIRELPKGFHTLVGERGVKLSGGQRQRIILARALAREPSFLILDEATSALDNESETLIQQAITGLKGKMTVLIIAHRLTTVLECDRLFVLEGGRITESGAPHTLLQQKESYFHKLYDLHKKP